MSIKYLEISPYLIGSGLHKHHDHQSIDLREARWEFSSKRLSSHCWFKFQESELECILGISKHIIFLWKIFLVLINSTLCAQ